MKTTTQTYTDTTYASEIMPEVKTQKEWEGKLIEWADKHPVVYEIVTKTKSKAFGKAASCYMGWAQNSNSCGAILHKIEKFYMFLNTPEISTSFFHESAKFTMEHYKDKGFKGGFFQHHDGRYDRICTNADYTKELLPSVIKRFAKWATYKGDKGSIRINDKVVATLPLEG